MGEVPKPGRPVVKADAVVAEAAFVRNVFDETNHLQDVPVTVVVNGEKKVVGEAKLYQNGDFVHAEIELKTDDADDVVQLFKDGITGIGDFSIPGEGVPVGGKHRRDDTDIQVAAGLVVHNHKPIQHRDGKPPWCRECGLDADYAEPESRIPAFGQPQVPNLRTNGE